jgi:hypothetical protein
MNLLEREVPEGDPHAADEALEQHLDSGRRLLAVRAFEITVFDDSHGSVLGTQHVVGATHGHGKLERSVVDHG